MSTNLTVQLEMLDHGGAAGSAVAVYNCLNSQIYLDPIDYDGATYYFEIDGHNSHAANDYYIQLRDVTDGVDLLTDNGGLGLLLPHGVANDTRYRSLSFVPRAGKHIVCARMPLTAAAGNVGAHAIRIVIPQVNATKTRLQVPMLVTEYWVVPVSTDGYVDRRNAITYGVTTSQDYTVFLKNSAVYSALSGATPWSFEAVLSSNDAAHIGYANLRNLTDATDVTGSEISVAGVTPTLVDAALSNAAVNWHDGDQFQVRIKSDNAVFYGNIHAARLYIKLDSLTIGEVFLRVGRAIWDTVARQQTQARSLLSLNSYSSPTCYFEVCGYCADNAVVVYLCDDDLNDTGTAGWTDIDGHNWNSGVRARYRSAALVLTNNYRYVVRSTASANTQTLCSHFIVVAFVGTLDVSYPPIDAPLAIVGASATGFDERSAGRSPTCSLLIGTTDLVGEGLVDPNSIRHSSSARGFESCDFPIPGSPHIVAHNALVSGAPVKLLRAGALEWEGKALTVDNAASPHVVACGGLYEECKRRQDFALMVYDTNTDGWQVRPPELLGYDKGITHDGIVVDTEGQLLICMPKGTKYSSGQGVIVAYHVLDGLSDYNALTVGIAARRLYAPFTTRLSSFTVNLRFVKYLYLTGDPADVDWTRNADSDGLIDLTAAHEADSIIISFIASADSAGAAADQYIQLRSPFVGGAAVGGCTVDYVIANYICKDIAVNSVLTTLGSYLQSTIAFLPFMTRADAIEQALARYSAPALCGFWDDSTLYIKPRPTAPDNRQRWYVVTDDDFADPADWNVVRDTEAELDAACAEFELEPTNLCSQPPPPSVVWPTEWNRDSVASCFVTDYYADGDYAFNIVSDGDSAPGILNPTARYRPPDGATGYVSVTAGWRYLFRFRAKVPTWHSGTAQVVIFWYTSGGAYISSAGKVFAAADTVEKWYEYSIQAPATAAKAQILLTWNSAAVHAGDDYLVVRDVEFRLITPTSTPQKVYYPTEPDSHTARVGLLQIGQSTLAEATNAAMQCYAWYSNLCHGQARPRSLRTIDGAPVLLSSVRSWDWISKIDDPDPDSGPLFISHAEYCAGVLVLDIGNDDAYAPPGYEHIKPVGRYVSGYIIPAYKKRRWVGMRAGKKVWKSVNVAEQVVEGHYE